MRTSRQVLLAMLLTCLFPAVASAQTYFQGGGSFRPQCPTATIRHPGPTPTGGTGTVVNLTPDYTEAPYTGPQVRTVAKDPTGVYTYSPPLTIVDSGGAIKCQQISGGDGMMTEADGNQTFMFSFGPLSGLNAIENGQPGTQFPVVFNSPYCDPARPNYNSGQPNPYYNTATNSCLPGTSPNGAVGYMPPTGFTGFPGNSIGSGATGAITAINNENGIDGISITNGGSGYSIGNLLQVIGAAGSGGTVSVLTVGPGGSITSLSIPTVGVNYVVEPVSFVFQLSPGFSVGTDSAAIMNTGVLNGNIPGPLFAFDEDDEFVMSLSNVGMIMRPDLFEQHTVHFHGYPNASSFYDGVPDATIAINIGGTFSYYYLAPDAGTYFWHCHITPPEHLQMGMVAWLYVRPRQNRIPDGTDPFHSSTVWEEEDLRTSCRNTGASNVVGTIPPDILCSAPQPAKDVGFVHAAPGNAAFPAGYKYVYDDGDGSTRYDIDVPLHIHGFDPNFHMVGMTFNAEGFSDMKDKYFLLNGRSYPDTVGVSPSSTVVNGTTLPANWSTYWAGGGVSGATNPSPNTNAISTEDTDTQSRASQPHSALIVLSASGGPANVCGQAVCGQRAALRIADLDVQEYQTLSSVGIPMLLVGFNAKILRDQAGNNLFIKTNSITLGGGESLDVILDSTGVPPGTYFLYTPQLDHLSNDAENFGGLVTEVVVTP